MSDPHSPAIPPGADEPKTPMWLPALGAALFIAVGLAWAVCQRASRPNAEPPAASASTSAAVPAASGAGGGR